MGTHSAADVWSVYVRFSRWSDKQAWQRIFQVLREDADFEEVYLDSTSCAPTSMQPAPRKKSEQALGRSREGLSTKIHSCVKGLGQLARFILTAGQVHDVTQAQALLETVTPEAVQADNAYDANALLACITNKQAKAVIPPTATRKFNVNSTAINIATAM